MAPAATSLSPPPRRGRVTTVQGDDDCQNPIDDLEFDEILEAAAERKERLRRVEAMKQSLRSEGREPDYYLTEFDDMAAPEVQHS